MKNEVKKLKSIVPKRQIFFASILTLGTIFQLSYQSIKNLNNIKEIENKHFPLLEFSAISLRLQEQIADGIVITSYEDSEQEITKLETLSQTLNDVLEEYQDLASKMKTEKSIIQNMNRDELSQLEISAFTYLRLGEKKKARELLKSENYLKLRNEFTENIQSLAEHFSLLREELISKQQRDLELDLIFIIASVLTILVLWFLVLKSFQHNIEKNQKTEDQLEQARLQSVHTSKLAAIGEMAGQIAHEINTPLAAIVLNTESTMRKLKKEKPDFEQIFKKLENIIKVTERISKIINSLKKFSRDNQKEVVTRAEVQELVDDTLLLCAERMKRKEIQFVYKMQEGLATERVECNQSEISQILINLLNNASDEIESHAEKWIQMNIYKSDKEIHFAITDSGKGIPEDILKKIFQPYFTTKDRDKGTGLGLSISKKLAQKNNGDLVYDHDAENPCFFLI